MLHTSSLLIVSWYYGCWMLTRHELIILDFGWNGRTYKPQCIAWNLMFLKSEKLRLNVKTYVIILTTKLHLKLHRKTKMPKKSRKKFDLRGFFYNKKNKTQKGVCVCVQVDGEDTRNDNNEEKRNAKIDEKEEEFSFTRTVFTSPAVKKNQLLLVFCVIFFFLCANEHGTHGTV